MKNKNSVFSGLWQIVRKTASAWVKSDPFGQSALVAYYSIFSIPALLVIIISLAGLIFGKEAVQGQISEQISVALGQETAKQVEGIIAKSSEHKTSVIAGIIGGVTLIIGSVAVFSQLQTSLNLIWGVKISVEKKWLKKIKDKILSFGMVLSIGFLLLVSLLITAALTTFGGWLKTVMPDFTVYIFKIIDFFFSFAVTSTLFAMMYKILPDVKIQWKDVVIGAISTSLLFILGKFALGVYFAKVDPGSAYGAAGSIILIMLWVSYSCMIFFFGAEFTKQFATFHGRKLEPGKDAVLIDDTQKEKGEHRVS